MENEKLPYIEGHYELRSGIHQRIILDERNGPHINIDVTHQAFPCQFTSLIKLLDAMQRESTPRIVIDFKKPLSKDVEKMLVAHLTDLEICYQIDDTTSGIAKFLSLGNRSSHYEVMSYENGTPIKVYEYFAEQKLPFKYPQLQCIRLERARGYISIPMECCSIRGDQVSFAPNPFFSSLSFQIIHFSFFLAVGEKTGEQNPIRRNEESHDHDVRPSKGHHCTSLESDQSQWMWNDSRIRAECWRTFCVRAGSATSAAVDGIPRSQNDQTKERRVANGIWRRSNGRHFIAHQFHMVHFEHRSKCDGHQIEAVCQRGMINTTWFSRPHFTHFGMVSFLSFLAVPQGGPAWHSAGREAKWNCLCCIRWNKGETAKDVRSRDWHCNLCHSTGQSRLRWDQICGRFGYWHQDTVHHIRYISKWHRFPRNILAQYECQIGWHQSKAVDCTDSQGFRCNTDHVHRRTLNAVIRPRKCTKVWTLSSN